MRSNEKARTSLFTGAFKKPRGEKVQSVKLEKILAIRNYSCSENEFSFIICYKNLKSGTLTHQLSKYKSLITSS